MNKQLWNIYKESERGRKVIEMFNPEIKFQEDGIKSIIEFSEKWERKTDVDLWLYRHFIFSANLLDSKLLPLDEEWTRDSFLKMVEEYQLYDAEVDENGEIKIRDEVQHMILSKKKFRTKVALIPSLSIFLYYHFTFFKPLLLPSHFDIIEENCHALNIELPLIPKGKDYKSHLLYYYDLCATWNDFQTENGFTDAECCACIYDYATLLNDKQHPTADLPKPTNVWITRASGGDFDFLDTLGKSGNENRVQIWACNERTRKGDIVVIYCTSPRSYIHSVWRADSMGKFNPFNFYHCRTTISKGVLTPKITFNELKSDPYFSNVPIVRKNLQGINGVELTAKDYSELLRIIKDKGFDTEQFPKLFEAQNIDFGEINLESDVEEKILIPLMMRLGYQKTDWTRQLSQKAGRGLKAIPDFVFFPKGKKYFASAPLIIEAKLDMSSIREQRNAFSQGLSYARLLRSSIMGLCDKERFILYDVDNNGYANPDSPIFEEHWHSIYSDIETGARLNQLIGRAVIAKK